MSLDDSGKEVEVFKMSLGSESILLRPLKNWGQLDTHKWVARGQLPDSPAGLEITHDHVKLAGETISTKDPEGCAKLAKVFAEWLELEKETMALARKKAAVKPATAAKQEVPPASQALHYKVELVNGQAHIRCIQGKETPATIGLTVAGFKSLFAQGLMRKPHALQTGALHDWVEIDGQLFSFEKGNNDSAKLEKMLNEHYVPAVGHGQGKDVLIFTNDASSTGFDIQFPVKVGGVLDNRRRPLNEEALDLLQDQDRCGLLHKGVVIKLSRPTFIFKQKTPDGGERYLESSPDNLVHNIDEDGNETVIDLSRPVNYMRLSTAELAAIFNHPALHKHGKAAPRPNAQSNGQSPPAPNAPALFTPPVVKPEAPAAVLAEPAGAVPPLSPPPRTGGEAPRPTAPPARALSADVLPADLLTKIAQGTSEPVAPATELPEAPIELEPAESGPPPVPLPASAALPPARESPAPNLWLADPLTQPVTRHDWFTCLVYSRIAERLENSFTVKLGLSNCWVTACSETRDVSDPAFRGFFLTEKRGLGFLSGGRIARFNKGVAFVGTQEEALEGIGVGLVAVGLDHDLRVCFIVTEDYRSKFGVPALARELALLKDQGVSILSVSEALKHPEPLQTVWTVPDQPGASGEPEAVENSRPDADQDADSPVASATE